MTILSDSAARSDLDSTMSSRCSYREARGYRQEGDYTFWEPTDPTDLESDTRSYGPGAMTVGEIDDYDGSDCEEF